ncbi:MAG: 16S rRNA (guanine(527)-N(7))-methyltransferase RsmG [Pikeienuella sp.]|uniref:16S rRNA (guanine(527)-N(7))-methyltransferase RsmG n=1 Tax=Pikeienuella sp. TaxID=2831957 RepID=UPI00391A10B6
MDLREAVIEPRDRLAGRVSRETLDRLDAYAALLLKWNRRINLIARSTVDDLWRRHILDSAQFAKHAPPDLRRWADIGSGAGLPGLIVAICLKETHPAARVTLVEKDERKAAFLAEVVASLDLDAEIQRVRLAPDMRPPFEANFDVVSARAVAPLAELLSLAAPLLAPGGLCILAKGRSSAVEIEEAIRLWRMNLISVDSETERDSVILKVEGLQRV